MTREQACELLEVEPAADLSAIRAQYRKLASRFHPDRFHTANEREAATEQFQAIAEAFALLRSEARDSKRRWADAPSGASMHATPWTRTTTTADGRTPIWWDTVETRASATAAPIGNATNGRADLAGAVSQAGDRLAMLLLFPVLLPSLVARVFSQAFTTTLDVGIGLPTSLSNFVGLLAGHVLPGYLGLELGHAIVQVPEQRAVAAILYALWWMLSAGLAVALDRVA